MLPPYREAFLNGGKTRLNATNCSSTVFLNRNDHTRAGFPGAGPHTLNTSEHRAMVNINGYEVAVVIMGLEDGSSVWFFFDLYVIASPCFDQ